MKDKLIEVLSRICPNVFLQGTYEENESYPETFITFFTIDVPDGMYYDNMTHSFDWSFMVNIYSSDPTQINELPFKIRSELIKEGFIVDGLGNDIPSDEPTHTGWSMDVIYRQIINESE